MTQLFDVDFRADKPGQFHSFQRKNLTIYDVGVELIKFIDTAPNPISAILVTPVKRHTYEIQLRGMRHATATVRIEAESDTEARGIALRMKNIPWDTSDVEDVQVETVERLP